MIIFTIFIIFLFNTVHFGPFWSISGPSWPILVLFQGISGTVPFGKYDSWEYQSFQSILTQINCINYNLGPFCLQFSPFWSVLVLFGTFLVLSGTVWSFFRVSVVKFFLENMILGSTNHFKAFWSKEIALARFEPPSPAMYLSFGKTFCLRTQIFQKNFYTTP